MSRKPTPQRDPEADALAPWRNPDLIGHERAEQAFLDAWGSGRLAHAWLLCGPRGIGKATLAFRIARFVLAGGGEGDLFGGPPSSLALAADHPVFRRVAARGHPDLCVIERTADEKSGKLRGEVVVADVRAAGSFLSLTPADGGWRVVVVDAACEMNRNAANGILKMLEEPPPRALLLLVSHSPGKLLPTIRSRCRKLVLRPLAEERVAGLARRAMPDLSAEEAAILARLGEGSVGRALALAGQGGATLYRDMLTILDGLPRLDVPALHAFGDRMARGESDDAFRTVGELFVWWLGRMIRAGGLGAPPVEVLDGESGLMNRLLAARRLDRWIEVWDNVTHLFSRAETLRLDRKQVVLNAFLAVERAARA
ncbi:MAG: DNA polymerase III subunit delta' [Alphaproteobacteria bacterium]|nr:DNA polymerase III subunit delta' [Alphaproteobacteria bacterium]